MSVQNVVKIDNIYFDVRIPENGIKRSFYIADTDNAGRKIDGTMERDIVGTYYNYTIQFDTQYMSHEEYDMLYLKLSAPVDFHIITVPFGQTTLTFNAYMANGSDILNRITNGKNYWKNLSIDFVAMEPYYRP